MTLPPLERGRQAAKSLAKQRRYLRNARKSLNMRAVNLARHYLKLWKEERRQWAGLVGRVEG